MLSGGDQGSQGSQGNPEIFTDLDLEILDLRQLEDARRVTYSFLVLFLSGVCPRGPILIGGALKGPLVLVE